MRHLESRRLIPGFIALSVLAALASVPVPAQASRALFRVHRIFYSTTTVANSLEPRTMAVQQTTRNGMTVMQPALPPAVAYVFNAAMQIVLPKAFIDYHDRGYCGEPMAGMCFPGYPISGGYYSYFNGKGYFAGPSHFGGSAGPTATTTVVFPTTMGNNLPFAPVTNHTAMSMNTFMDLAPNSAMGKHATAPGGMTAGATTLSGGIFDFSRGGSIQITPGANKFSGTMRLINGPNATFYQFITYFTPNLYKAYGKVVGSMYGAASNDPTNLGETTLSSNLVRYLLTPVGAKRATDGMGGYISSPARYFHVLGPWTTGKVRIFNVLGYYQTRITQTGYSKKAPGKVDGLTPTRVVSFVRPRLKHAFLDPANPAEPIFSNYQAARVWRMNVLFLPEPGEVALLLTGVAGLAGLVGLTRLRRR